MSTDVFILTIGVAAAVLVALITMALGPEPELVDAEQEKRWIVRSLRRFPRLAWFLQRRLDPASTSGLTLTLGFLVVLALAVFVGAVFDMVDQNTGFARLDTLISEYGASLEGSLFSEVQAAFTRLGGTRVITGVTIAAGAWAWWRYRNYRIPLFLTSVAVGQALINNGIKWIVSRERPAILHLAPFSGSSFPSGHSAAAAATYAAVALVLTIDQGRGARAVAAGLATFVAVGVAATRTMLGVHWFTDVLAGLAVGFAWFVVCAVAFGNHLRSRA